MTGPIDQLANVLARLPGLGPRSARRAVLHLITRRESTLGPLIRALQEVDASLKTCGTCGNIDVSDPCGVCLDERRDRSTICVVEGVADLWALERAQQYRGLYHVLGGHLSALDGVRPEDLSIDRLLDRAGHAEVQEVILALNATIEGQATVHYVRERLANSQAAITQLAHGVPVGGELDYLDEGTLVQAMKSRRPPD